MLQLNDKGKSLRYDFQLPTLPEIAMRILDAVKQDNFSFQGLGEIISSDPALMVKILKMANSSFYALPQKVNTIEKAISILGVCALKNIALSFVISKEFKKSGNYGFDFGYFWKRSVTTAIAADLTGKLLLDKSDDLFVNGLLMDIGSIIMYMNHPDMYLTVLEDKRVSQLPITTIEKTIFGCDHQFVGGSALKAWGLDESIFNPVLNHHNSDTASEQYKTRSNILYIANKISGTYHSLKKTDKFNVIKKHLKSLYEISDREIENLVDTVAEKSLEVFSTFEIDPGDMKPYSQILQEANEELGNLVYSYEQLLMNFKEEKEKAEKLAKELQEKNEKLRTLSVRDGLTNLYNHNYFQESLELEISRTNRQNQSFSLIMFDLDNFKILNDTHGHRIGDIVLQSIGSVVLSLIRKNDIAARYGGEEFTIILPETHLKGAVILAERVRKTIEELEISAPKAKINVTVSVGVVSYQANGKRKTKAQLIDAADAAMYHAKQTGKNKLSVAN